jgi:cytochrome b561
VKFLHWLVATLIFTQFALGWVAKLAFLADETQPLCLAQVNRLL